MTRKVFLVCIALAALMLPAAASFGAIGIYKWSAGATVSSNISYMLNTDANDTSGPWALKIEIVPAAGGAAVKTWTFPAGHANCAKGMHTNAVTWDGTTDGGGYAPSGNYKAVITAKAAPVTGADLQPLWEIDNLGSYEWRDAAVNNNPASPWYGCVYAINGATGLKNVYMWDPDGTFVKTFVQPADGWANSAPHGIDCADDGTVIATSYSKSYAVGYNGDGTPTHPNAGKPDYFNIGAAYGSYNNPRTIIAGGTQAANFKVFATYWTPTQVNPSGSRVYSQTGYPPAAPWGQYAAPLQNLMEGDFAPDGNVVLPAYNSLGGTSGGEIVKMDMLGAVLQTNSTVTRGVGAAYTIDGQWLWVSRFVTGTAPYDDPDPTTLWKIPAATVFTTDGSDIQKFGINCSNANKRTLGIDCDGVGNVVACAGTTDAGFSAYPRSYNVGVYAPPDSGSTDVRETGTIWSPGGDHQPVITGTNGPVEISSCVPGSTGVLQVYVTDLEGCGDVASCSLDRSAFGQSVVPMNKVGCVGNDATFELEIDVPSGQAPGEYALPVTVRDAHYPTVFEVIGSIVVKVTGGTISGTVTNSVTGWGVKDATVTANDGFNTFTATTDADGIYLMDVSPGSYTVTASHTGFAPGADPPTPAVVDCGVTVTDVNYTLPPLNIRQCANSNYRYDYGRGLGEHVCVQATVLRTHAVTGGQAGLDGYYYLTDNSYQGTQQGLKVMVYSGQSDLHEGDMVVVEGTWTAPNGIYQGHVVPTRAPYLVSTGNPLPAAAQFYGNQINYTYGRYFKASGQCNGVTPPNRFTIQVPTSATDPTPVTVIIVADTAATTGVTLPAVNDFVDVTAILSMIDVFGSNVLIAGKAADVHPWGSYGELGDLKAAANGGAIFDAGADPAKRLVVTYVDPGEIGGLANQNNWFWVESKDRTCGLKVMTMKTAEFPGHIPAGLKPGDEISYMKGRLATVATAGREFQLVETPTAVINDPQSLAAIPPFVTMNAKAFGGGANGYTPGAIGSGGANNDGILARVAGRAYGYGYDADWEWFYLDDGSLMPNENGQFGIKVIRSATEWDPTVLFPTVDGTFVIAEGIVTSNWVGATALPPDGGRIRVLHIRYDQYNWEMISDQVQIITP